MISPPNQKNSSVPSMTDCDADDVITLTGIPEVNISVPDKKKVALDKLRFSIQELISEFSEPYDKDEYLTTQDIKSAINDAFDVEIEWRTKQLGLINDIKKTVEPFVF